MSLSGRKMSLSDRFGTMKQSSLQEKSSWNSNMVEQLKLRISNVMKRREGTSPESLAKKIGKDEAECGGSGAKGKFTEKFDGDSFQNIKVQLTVNAGNKAESSTSPANDNSRNTPRQLGTNKVPFNSCYSNQTKKQTVTTSGNIEMSKKNSTTAKLSNRPAEKSKNGIPQIHRAPVNMKDMLDEGETSRNASRPRETIPCDTDMQINNKATLKVPYRQSPAKNKLNSIPKVHTAPTDMSVLENGRPNYNNTAVNYPPHVKKLNEHFGSYTNRNPYAKGKDVPESQTQNQYHQPQKLPVYSSPMKNNLYQNTQVAENLEGDQPHSSNDAFPSPLDRSYDQYYNRPAKNYVNRSQKNSNTDNLHDQQQRRNATYWNSRVNTNNQAYQRVNENNGYKHEPMKQNFNFTNSKMDMVNHTNGNLNGQEELPSAIDMSSINHTDGAKNRGYLKQLSHDYQLHHQIRSESMMMQNRNFTCEMNTDKTRLAVYSDKQRPFQSRLRTHENGSNDFCNVQEPYKRPSPYKQHENAMIPAKKRMMNEYLQHEYKSSNDHPVSPLSNVNCHYGNNYKENSHPDVDQSTLSEMKLVENNMNKGCYQMMTSETNDPRKRKQNGLQIHRSDNSYSLMEIKYFSNRVCDGNGQQFDSVALTKNPFVNQNVEHKENFTSPGTENVPTGFYRELPKDEVANVETEDTLKQDSSGPSALKEQLIDKLLVQCQGLVQKEKDREALGTIFDIIQRETTSLSTSFETTTGTEIFDGKGDIKKDQKINTVVPQNVSSELEKLPSDSKEMDPRKSLERKSSIESNFSPTLSSPDYYAKPNSSMKFEGRTLLKGGVDPRHIPKNVLIKHIDDPPTDPRDSYRQKNFGIDIPLPPFFVEFVATEKKLNDKGTSQLKKITEKSDSNLTSEVVQVVKQMGSIQRKDTTDNLDEVDMDLEHDIEQSKEKETRPETPIPVGEIDINNAFGESESVTNTSVHESTTTSNSCSNSKLNGPEFACKSQRVDNNSAQHYFPRAVPNDIGGVEKQNSREIHFNNSLQQNEFGTKTNSTSHKPARKYSFSKSELNSSEFDYKNRRIDHNSAQQKQKGVSHDIGRGKPNGVEMNVNGTFGQDESFTKTNNNIQRPDARRNSFCKSNLNDAEFDYKNRHLDHNTAPRKFQREMSNDVGRGDKQNYELGKSRRNHFPHMNDGHNVRTVGSISPGRKDRRCRSYSGERLNIGSSGESTWHQEHMRNMHKEFDRSLDCTQSNNVWSRRHFPDFKGTDKTYDGCQSTDHHRDKNFTSNDGGMYQNLDRYNDKRGTSHVGHVQSTVEDSSARDYCHPRDGRNWNNKQGVRRTEFKSNY